MDLLMAAGAVVVPALGLYAASCFGEVNGIHDWIVPGAVFRTPHPHRVLTFDDGPHPERTPRLLDILATSGARAVFFMVGAEAMKHRALVRRVAEEGHLIGNHSFSHPWMLPMARRRIEEEIDRCQNALAEITGTAPALARPPYGQRDYRYNRVLKERGLTPVLWSQNLRDYWGQSPDVLIGRLGRSRPGDILLLHDGDPKAKGTVAAVEGWLKTNPLVGLL
jgi:peptidoglycan/xylan/chitin deacetylase (PgdA/CDA1 family)